MSPSSRASLAVLAVVVAASTATAAADATTARHHRHHRPDLVVGGFDLTVTGRVVTGTVTVRNTGNARAPRSVTSAGGALISTPALRAGHRARLVVATTLPAGATRLLLCVDVRHRVRESNEADNCQIYTVPTTASPSSGPTAIGSPVPKNPGVHASTGPVAN